MAMNFAQKTRTRVILRSDGRRRGAALVLVLSVLVLLAGLVVAIFYTSQSDRQSASLFAGSFEAKSLAETSVNLVIAQITDATRQTGRAWISQPGLIRTFTGNRVPETNYRLYSWADLRPNGRFDPFSALNAVPADWRQRKAFFVDLNEPTPDPNAPSDPSRDKYPILYPPNLTASSGGGNVAGYKVSDASVPGGTTGNAVPMPVQWLYVLRDGKVNSATAGASGSEVVISGASASNPIVGRIAFWTDDESAKVNVNTAAGGLFWTPPWFQTSKEYRAGTNTPYGFGFSQPVKNEFQRYPGHPARTALRAVFPELTWSEIYRITPRILGGGSANGEVQLSDTVPILQDTDRLYASLGELRFNAMKILTGARGERAGEFSSLSDPEEWLAMVEKRKGFLTASSRSPELTLFGNPRVVAWPLPASTSPDDRTALDKLIAFCSTITSGGNSHPFYFTRGDAASSNADINISRNRELYAYLQRLTSSPVPGVSGAAFADSSKYGALGRDQILTEIFDYIRSTNIQDIQLPDTKWFSRSSIIAPTKWDAGNGATSGFGRTLALRQVGFQFICTADAANPDSNRAPGDPAAGSIKENLSLAAGGKLLANQRRIQALFHIELFSPSAGFKQFALAPAIRVRGLDGMTLGTTLTAPQSLGFPGGTTPPATPPPGIDLSSYPGSFGGTGGALNYRWLFTKVENNARSAHDMRPTASLPGNAAGYPYVSVPVTLTIDPNSPEMNLSGGSLTIKIFSDSTLATLLNTVVVNIDPVTLPVPMLHPNNKHYWAFHRSGIFGDRNPPGRFETDQAGVDSPFHTPPRSDMPGYGETTLITRYDTVQTYILPHGDYRALFAPAATSLKTFIPVPDPGPTGLSSRHRHFLSDHGYSYGVYGFYPGTTFTPDVAVNWTTHFAPPIRRRADYPATLTAPWTFGDWDMGSPMTTTDGPLINKPDEGNLFRGNDVNNPFATDYSDANAGYNYNYGTDYHSANRQIPSAVMFGSLPTGLIAGQPWQTLLFRPDPGGHPGAEDPADHLLLDLFWMPIVEPYAISEPFSTAGKVNLNYQMIPFTYIERSTALRAVLQDEGLVAVPEDRWPNGFGKSWSNTIQQNREFHQSINTEETLAPLRSKFSGGEVFLTASEVTQIPLVPNEAGVTSAGMPAFWAAHRLTGENIQERAYATIYPRLTTKSNVFNVHYRVQVLKKKPGSVPTVWDEGKDALVAENRGNTIVERFIDMNRADIPDFAVAPSASAEDFFRFRILSTKQFNP